MYRLYALAIILASATLFMIFGCGDDPVRSRPHQPDYRLLVNFSYYPDSDSTLFYLVYSTRTDSVVDSIYIGDESSIDAVFSNDGHVLYHTNIFDDITYSTDWATGDTIAVDPEHGGEKLSVAGDDGHLLVTEFFPIILFKLPELTPVIEVQRGGKGQIIPNRKLACYHQNASDSLYYIDFSQSPPDTFALPFRGQSGEIYGIQAFTATASGDSLIIIGEYNRENWYVFIATTDSLKVLDRISIPLHDYWQGHLLMHPNGKIVYFYYPGSVIVFPPVRGVVYGLDLQTGELTVLIDKGYYEYIRPWDLAITPEGDYLYVLSRGRLFKIRLSDNEISDLTGERDLGGYSIAINPIDYAQ
jgi:DNA-binding beta-propeller fold protein YncE